MKHAYIRRETNRIRFSSRYQPDFSLTSAHTPWHCTTHLIAFTTNFPVPSPTIHFGQNVTVIACWNVQNTTSPSMPVSPEAPRYCLWWFGLIVRQLLTSHMAVLHLSSCNRPGPLTMKCFVHHCNEGNIKHSARQLREICWRTLAALSTAWSIACFPWRKISILINLSSSRVYRIKHT
jgi:hypothetical protein